MKRIFSFPNPVNEVSARLVAGTVATICVSAIAGQWAWLAIPVAYGFIARALTGPTLSPLGQLVTRGITPRLPVKSKYVAGPPKRFAQSIGAVLSSAAAVTYLSGTPELTYVLLGMVAIAATLEAGFAFCIGCKIFDALMRLGAIPASICLECQNISLHRAKVESR